MEPPFKMELYSASISKKAKNCGSFNKLIVDQMGKVDIDEVTYNDWVEFVNSLQ